MPFNVAAKSAWRRSIKLPGSSLSTSHPAMPHSFGSFPPTAEPVTLAIIGCGQRGRVRLDLPTPSPALDSP